MKRWEAILAIIGGCLVACSAYAIQRASLPRHSFTLDQNNCRTPITVIEPPHGMNAGGAAILLHGLSANRRVMIYLGEDFAGHGFRTFLPDLAGHGDNTNSFTFAKAEECADWSVQALMQREKLDPRKTILLGHSMGGAIAIRMADMNPVAATIALSPAPMTLPRRMPANLLVFSAQFDLGVLKRQAGALAKAAGGTRTAPDDFAQKRAFEWQMVPYATHTSELLEREVAHRSEQWAAEALLPNVAPRTLILNLDLATHEMFHRERLRLTGAIAGLLGLLLLFPACATIVSLAAEAAGTKKTAQMAVEDRAESPRARPTFLLGVAEQAVCALVAVLILALVIPLRFVYLYQGDYLASAMFVSGALLLALNWSYAKGCLEVSWPKIGAAAVLGMAAMLAAGGWLNWQLTDLWLNGARWLRFAALLPGAWIFCFAEEVLLGTVGKGKHRALRYGVSLALRLELWLACVLAYYELASGEALIGLLVIGMAVFSAVQRLGTDGLRHRTGSATAAAVFDAILSAWFIAAVFPLT
ncbi:MAG TPA: alpha/beta fold hydrolase [Candidatus Acidoferrales bacterium]|nr:alpha/beta fold hydrolase [Candidatus Acidoferrales bacterium]